MYCDKHEYQMRQIPRLRYPDLKRWSCPKCDHEADIYIGIPVLLIVFVIPTFLSYWLMVGF